MRFALRILALVFTLGLLGAGGRSAAAQQFAPSSSPSLPILHQYDIPLDQLPNGLTLSSGAEITNAEQAADMEDPAQIQTFIDRGRLDGVDRVFHGASGGAGHETAYLTLYSGSAGAQADLKDFPPQPGLTITQEAPPNLGDASVLARLSSTDGSGNPFEEVLAGFTLGRLEVVVYQSGPAGSVNDDDVMPLLATYAQRAPAPPPATANELAILKAQGSPESILYDAYTFLLDRYPQRLYPSDVLGSAFAGAAQAVAATGVRGLPQAPQVTSSDPDEAWGQFLPAYLELETLGKSVDPRDLAYAAAAGMYDVQNCHTAFETPRNYSGLFATDTGQPSTGSGLQFAGLRDAPYTVLRALPGSPADKAGVRAGDQVIAINHETLQEAGSRFTLPLVGAAGTAVILTINRPGTSDPFDLTLTLGPVQPFLEQHQILDSGIGYVELDQFLSANKSVDAVRGALDAFAAAGNVSGWVLDLRYNRGGSDTAIAQVAGLFLPENSFVMTAVSQNGTASVLRSAGAPLADQKPLVILTGPNTASAAEIVTQALHDSGRAKVIGSPTAGCVDGGGLVGFLDGSGAFISNHHVLAGPNTVALEHRGVTLDQRVDLTRDALASGNDPQLAAAVALLTSGDGQ